MPPLMKGTLQNAVQTASRNALDTVTLDEPKTARSTMHSTVRFAFTACRLREIHVPYAWMLGMCMLLCMCIHVVHAHDHT